MKHEAPQEGGLRAAYVSPDATKYSTTASQRSIIYQELKQSEDGLTTFDIRSKFDIHHRVASYVQMPERQGRLL